MSDPTPDDGFYFNLHTQQVEQGWVSSWETRMGPYRTREEAAHAFEFAARRNKAMDDADDEWNDKDDD